MIDLRGFSLYIFNKPTGSLIFCQTPGLGLSLGVDFTFSEDQKNHKNPHLIFLRREGTRGVKFGTQTYLTIISSGYKKKLVLKEFGYKNLKFKKT